MGLNKGSVLWMHMTIFAKNEHFNVLYTYIFCEQDFLKMPPHILCRLILTLNQVCALNSISRTTNLSLSFCKEGTENVVISNFVTIAEVIEEQPQKL